jgi:hypothetical protein
METESLFLFQGHEINNHPGFHLEGEAYYGIKTKFPYKESREMSRILNI